MEKDCERRVRETIRKDRDIVQLDLQKVADHFVFKGYDVLELKQPWRHVVGKLKKDNQIFFVKLASTPALANMRTRREKIWLDFVGQYLSGQEPFILPKTYGNGWYNENLFWFTTDWIEPNPLATKKPPDPKNLEEWLPAIATAANTFLSIPPPRPGEDLYEEMYQGESLEEKTGDPSERILASASYWARESGQDLNNLIQEIKRATGKLKPAVTHGDFAPWHMFQVDVTRFALIDADLGSFRAPRYYDAAGFYHSVWVRLGEQYSKDFLNHFTKIHGKRWGGLSSEFRPVLAQRIAGGFWDKKNEGDENLKPNFAILKAFHNNKLL